MVNPLMEEAVVIDENAEGLPDYYDVFRPVILNIPTEIFRGYMNRTCSALLEFIAWHGTKLDKRTGELIIRPVIISQAFFCRRFGLSRDWIGKMTKRLEELGYLKVYRRKDNRGRYLANIYVVSEHILNKTLLKFLKSGELKDECEKLQNLNLFTWTIAVPKGIADIPLPPELRNEDSFREFFKTIYLRIKDGKLNYEDFINLLIELFELKKKFQQKEEDDCVSCKNDYAYLIDEGEDDVDVQDFLYEKYTKSGRPLEEEEEYEEDEEEDEYSNESAEDERMKDDYINSGFQEIEEAVWRKKISTGKYVIVYNYKNTDSENGNRTCPVWKFSHRFNDEHVAFYCRSGDKTYLCVCAPEKEFRRAVFRSKELTILKVLYSYLRSRNFPMVTDTEIARFFKTSRKRARYLLYLLGATPVIVGFKDLQWYYFTGGIESPWKKSFAFEWVVWYSKESIPVISEEKNCLEN